MHQNSHIEEYDVVIIGADDDGLAAAESFAGKGLKTLLLEQNNIPGGFPVSFIRGRFEFKSFPHEIFDLRSHENKDMKIRELGGRIEYNTKVEKVLMDNGKIIGLETSQGDIIKTNRIVSNLNPCLVYSQLKHPKTEVPDMDYKTFNTRKVGSSAFVVYLGLDKTFEELNLSKYIYFNYTVPNTDEILQKFPMLKNPMEHSAICLNNVIPDCSPSGTSIMYMLAPFNEDCWVDVKPEEYFNLKSQLANHMIDEFEKTLGVNIKDSIEEIEIATPLTFAYYTGVPSNKLHPEHQYLIVSKVINNTEKVKTFRLTPDISSGTLDLAYFRPGQYLSFIFNIGNTTVTRPYSISSSPKEALYGFYEITIEKNQDGYVSNYIFNNWNEGTKVKCSGPQGHFYYENLRDSSKTIGLAGGCGITPFRSIIRAIAEGTLDIEMTLFYGNDSGDEIIFYNELNELSEASKGKIKIIHVCGLITRNLIEKHINPKDKTIFICGPQAMYRFLHKDLKTLNLRKKFLRWETFGEIKDVNQVEEYPKSKTKDFYQIVVHIGADTHKITALSKESILVAMERAGIKPPSLCRSGECGFCKSFLIRGNVFITDTNDGRRLLDKKYGYIHPCSSFPISDLEIIVPRPK